MEFKNTTIKDIQIWWACAKTQAEELIENNKKESDVNVKAVNEKLIQMLMGMAVAFAMVLENENKL